MGIAEVGQAGATAIGEIASGPSYAVWQCELHAIRPHDVHDVHSAASD